MTYNESKKKATLRYTQKKLKSLTIRYKLDDYEGRILPAIKRSGLPVATFFKQAVKEKIERDELEDK